MRCLQLCSWLGTVAYSRLAFEGWTTRTRSYKATSNALDGCTRTRWEALFFQERNFWRIVYRPIVMFLIFLFWKRTSLVLLPNKKLKWLNIFPVKIIIWMILFSDSISLILKSSKIKLKVFFLALKPTVHTCKAHLWRNFYTKTHPKPQILTYELSYWSLSSDDCLAKV